MPRSHDGTLDFGIAPALPAAVPARTVSAGISSTAASFDGAVGGSDMVARDFFPAPRPQDGIVVFGIAPALPAAAPTLAVSAGNSSTASSFDAAVRESDTDARPFFPRLAHNTASWFSVLRLRCLLLCPPAPFLLEIAVRLRVSMLLLEGAIWSLVPFSHASPTRRHRGFRYCACVARCFAHPRRFCWKLQYGCEF